MKSIEELHALAFDLVMSGTTLARLGKLDHPDEFCAVLAMALEMAQDACNHLAGGTGHAEITQRAMEYAEANRMANIMRLNMEVSRGN